MRIIISPAKQMREDRDTLPPRGLPGFLPETGRLLSALRNLSPAELQKLWKCNDAIAALNVERLRTMDLERGLTPALLSYVGIQYQTMAARVFETAQYEFLQEHLRILSGFYGLLRPFDGVTPYRLEMGAKLKTPFCKSLYDFWGDSLGEFLFQEDSVLVNLASEEYAKAVRPAVAGKGRFVTCVFAEEPEPGRLVEKGVYVKMARGEMVRFAAEHNVQSPEGLQGFSRLGYAFDLQRSTGDTYLFCRSAPPKRLKNF